MPCAGAGRAENGASAGHPVPSFTMRGRRGWDGDGSEPTPVPSLMLCAFAGAARNISGKRFSSHAQRRNGLAAPDSSPEV